MENQEAVPAPAVPAQARRRRPTPDHPPYSEMVQCAIRSLAEKRGSTESAISAYIEFHYPSLPWAHSRLLPYYLRKLLLAREISKSPIPTRYILPEPSLPNPSSSPSRRPKSPRKRGRPRKEPPASPPERCRGRPRTSVMPEPEPEPEPPPQRPRLILRLKRSKVIQIHPDGGVVSGCAWQCLKECVGEKESKGAGSCIHDDDELSSASMRENDLGGMKSDAEVSALRDENVKGAEIDEHYEELLALQENGLSGNRSRERNEELSVLREEDLNGIMIDERDEELSAAQEGDADGIETAVHTVEPSLFEVGDANGIEIAEHNGGLRASRASQENDLDSIRADEHNGELSVLREGDLNAIRVVEHNGDLSELQESNVNSVGIMEHNGQMSELNENDLNSNRSDDHNEELLALHIVPDAASYKKSGSDLGMQRKKAKPRKTRRLWYES